jgi:hypothetical protein
MSYVRSFDGAEMSEVAPSQYVNVKSALLLKLASLEQVEAARRSASEQQKQDAAA